MRHNLFYLCGCSMEKELAILIADLSGYTALTETHGASAAADLIDRYLQMVEKSLVGNCHLHERTGDEIMIVSEVPDHLLATALQLLYNSHREEKFLLLHGGLHIGQLLKRPSGYFGAALNFTARIAAQATAGTIWCSQEFRDSLNISQDFLFENKGLFEFKNVTGRKEMFELKTNKANFFQVDPVCRMLLLSKEQTIPHPTENVYFCSQQCLDVYNAQIGSSVLQ